MAKRSDRAKWVSPFVMGGVALALLLCFPPFFSEAARARGAAPARMESNPGETAVPAPLRSFDTVAALMAELGREETRLRPGDPVSVLGYYAQGDGGGGRYEILPLPEDGADDGMILRGAVLAARLQVEGDAVSVLQFGARADGQTDDWAAIEAALHSPASVVRFPAGGRLMVRDNLHIGHDGMTLEGNGATLLMDDGFRGKEEFFLAVAGVSGVTIDGLNITCTQTRNPGPYLSQIGVMGARDVRIIGCALLVPQAHYENGVSTIQNINNIDLYSDWRNVEISGCTLRLMHDGEAGLCVLARDFYGMESGGLRMTGNACYKVCHDEIVALYGLNGAVLEDIHISDNSFIMETGKGASTSNIGISFGAGDVQRVAGVWVENNAFVIETDFAGFLFAAVCENITIRGNDITLRRGPVSRDANESTLTSVFFQEDGADPHGAGSIEIADNTVRIDNSSPPRTVDHIFDVDANIHGNTVRVQGDVAGYVFGPKVTAANGNHIEISGNLEAFTYNARGEITGNKLAVGNTVNYLFRFLFTRLDRYVSILDNEITGGSAAPSARLLSVDGLSMEGNVITIDSNTIDIPGESSFLCTVDIADSDAQTIVFGGKNVISSNFNRQYVAAPQLMRVRLPGRPEDAGALASMWYALRAMLPWNAVLKVLAILLAGDALVLLFVYRRRKRSSGQPRRRGKSPR